MILGILVLEFGTFRSTLIVASVIPLGVARGILTLFFVGYTPSFTPADRAGETPLPDTLIPDARTTLGGALSALVEP
jgi:hypothetical protein